MTNRPVVIGLTMGDPAGIGPELALLSAQTIDPDFAHVIIIGDKGRLEAARRILADRGRLSDQVKVQAIGSTAEFPEDPHTVVVRDLHNVPAELPWGKVSAQAGQAAYEYLDEAVKLAKSGQIDAICTAPINKEAWRLAGIRYPGHTEALADLTGSPRYAMMLKNQRLRAVHVTTHVGLVEAIRLLSPERILATVTAADQYLKLLGLRRPHLAVAALNPHGGEGGIFGVEEETIIRPAVFDARHRGFHVDGPLPADTVFARGAQGEFDAVIALYHDQGHIAVKMLGLDSGVNITIGLPILRTSVDHGTAFDIAGQGVASEQSMIEALKAAVEEAKLKNIRDSLSRS